MNNDNMYNCDKMIPLPSRPDHVAEVPVQPVGDFIGLRFSERMLIDVTIEKNNNPPKVVSISKGSFVRITYVNKSRIDELSGVIKDISTVKERKAPVQTNRVACACNGLPHYGSYFTIVLDCSTSYQSQLYTITSDMIRDIDLITVKDPNADDEDKCKCCDCCKCKEEETKPPEGDNTGGEDISGDMDITPDEEIEGDDDFGTDPGNTENTNPDDTATDKGLSEDSGL